MENGNPEFLNKELDSPINPPEAEGNDGGWGHGFLFLAVRRGHEVFTNPESDFMFKAGDIILFTGERKSMAKALDYFKGEA